MEPPTAIQTSYRGYLFRSRLEARWAVFFDTLKIKWNYEPQGYSLPPVCGGGEPVYYLPDFEIPAQPDFPTPLWIEIKGIETPVACDKMTRLVMATGIRGTILGEIPYPDDISPPDGYGMNWSYNLCKMELSIIVPEGEDYGYCFCECPFCGKFGFEFDGRSARINCDCKEHGYIANGDKTYNNASPVLMAAYKAARSARFEHGREG